ncbi:hypothetical protein ABW21_db0204024 [Orbilia brochopaga]|nr:hypothetical protein ABW21_db0204024 [Drechslerella brochopaga]
MFVVAVGIRVLLLPSTPAFFNFNATAVADAMKILEPREAMLSNQEVLAHVQDVKRRYREEINEQDILSRGKRSSLTNDFFDDIFDDIQLLDYLSSTVASAQSPTSINTLVETLVKYQFEKIEVLMILNNLPKNETELDVLVEELESRLSDDEIAQVLDTIRTIFGSRTRDVATE